MQTQLFTKGKTNVKSMVAMLLMAAFTGSAAAAGKPVPCGSLRTPSTCAEPPPVLNGLRARIFCLHRSLRRHETGIDWPKVVIPPGSTLLS